MNRVRNSGRPGFLLKIRGFRAIKKPLRPPFPSAPSAFHFSGFSSVTHHSARPRQPLLHFFQHSTLNSLSITRHYEHSLNRCDGCAESLPASVALHVDVGVAIDARQPVEPFIGRPCLDDPDIADHMNRHFIHFEGCHCRGLSCDFEKEMTRGPEEFRSERCIENPVQGAHRSAPHPILEMHGCSRR